MTPHLILASEALALFVPPPSQGVVEQTIIHIVLWLKLVVETLGALVISLGIAGAAQTFARAMLAQQRVSFNLIRLRLARYLALALEFQLGADILSTAIAPSWDQIGKLAAVAVIRTALNYFLTREMREEQSAPEPPAATVTP